MRSRSFGVGALLGAGLGVALVAGCTVASSVGAFKPPTTSSPGDDAESDAGSVDAGYDAADGSFADLSLALQVRPLAASIKSSCALASASHHVSCWGDNSHGTVGHPPTSTNEWYGDAVAVDLGTFSAATLFGGPTIECALDAGGQAMCWGRSSFFSRTGDFAQSITSPALVAGLAPGQVAMAVGLDFLCALHATGRVKCWGGNGTGQLGNGSLADQPSPRDVSGLPPVAAVIASMGASFVYARTPDGALYAWGDASSGVLDDGAPAVVTRPRQLPGLSDVRDVAPGRAHVCVLDGAGAVSCWGQGGSGQLAGASSARFSARVTIPLPGPAASIAAGFDHTCALLRDTRVFCWGDNGQMQAQVNGPTVVPSPVEGFDGSTGTTAIAASMAHTCAFGAKDIFCFGGVVMGTYTLPH